MAKKRLKSHYVQLNLKVSPEVKEHIQRLAEERGVRYTDLISEWANKAWSRRYPGPGRKRWASADTVEFGTKDPLDVLVEKSLPRVFDEPLRDVMRDVAREAENWGVGY